MKVKSKISFIVVLALVLSLLLSGCSSGGNKSSSSANTSKSTNVSKPVSLTIIDVAGTTQLVQSALDKFKKDNPNIVSDIQIIKAPATELVGKIKSQQMANNVTTAMVFTGYDGLNAGIQDNIWEQILPQYNNEFPNLMNEYLDGAKQAYDQGKGYGLPIAYSPGGPMLTYNPDKVTEILDTPQKLLDWAKAHPGKFIYARPANSGPGRAFLQGLPYLLGDKNPKDPTTWDKTWAYLKELNKYIDYYPTGTSITFKEFAEGTRWVVASHIGWDMNERILGIIPPNSQGVFFQNMTWVTDAHFMCIPKGLDDNTKKAAIALMKYLLEPAQQAVTYDSGYFYPGPAIKNVPLSMAPSDSQTKVKSAMRDSYEKAIKEYPTTPQLGPKEMVEAFDMWDKLIGSGKLK
jgi:putative spermidine/putrescine transport system substrate-binding protein